MSDDFLEKLRKNRVENIRKHGGFLSPYSVTSEVRASPETTSLNVIERVPRLLFSLLRRRIRRNLNLKALKYFVNFFFFFDFSRRTRSLNAPSPFQQFGPCGRIMKNSAMVMQIQDPASQRLTWYKPPLGKLDFNDFREKFES